jgi:adenine-specific DNA-methyltransferase
VFGLAKFKNLLADGRIVFGRDGTGRPSVKKFLSEISQGVLPQSVWLHDEVGHNQESSREIREISPENPFSTPKPERLLQRIIRLATNPGDLVLDSFLGSGTTAAVAHKMGRRWIGIEMGEHARTHCQPRLAKVIDGEQGGISQAVGWQGGGGFRFYQLGPKVFDDRGRINPEIKFEHLAAHIWFAETGTARSTRAMKSPLLGVHGGTAYYLLYNGILGDQTLAGGNMLTMKLLASLPTHDGPMVIYGEGTNLSDERLRSLGITFKKTPNDIRAR